MKKRELKERVKELEDENRRLRETAEWWRRINETTPVQIAQWGNSSDPCQGVCGPVCHNAFCPRRTVVTC